MFCSKCGSEISENDNYCSKCGNIIKRNDIPDEEEPPVKKRVIFSSVMLFMLIIASCVYAYLSKVGSTINLDDSNIPEILPKADNCSSPYVESEVLTIFKAINPFYKNIALKSIDSLSILSKETVSEDKENAKYVCSGIIELTSDTKGFRPSNYEETNIFYNKVLIEGDNDKIIKYTFYETPIFYSSQMIEGKNFIEINEIGEGEFGCRGVCAPVYKYTKKIKSVPVEKEIEETPINNIEQNIKNNTSDIEIEKSISKNQKLKKEKRKFKFFKREKKIKELKD